MLADFVFCFLGYLGHDCFKLGVLKYLFVYNKSYKLAFRLLAMAGASLDSYEMIEEARMDDVRRIRQEMHPRTSLREDVWEALTTFPYTRESRHLCGGLKLMGREEDDLYEITCAPPGSQPIGPLRVYRWSEDYDNSPEKTFRDICSGRFGIEKHTGKKSWRAEMLSIRLMREEIPPNANAILFGETYKIERIVADPSINSVGFPSLTKLGFLFGGIFSEVKSNIITNVQRRTKINTLVRFRQEARFYRIPPVKKIEE